MTYLIQIGDARGVRIPPSIIKRACLQNAELELKVVPEGLLISPIKRVRQGWAEAYEANAKSENKMMFPDSVNNQFDTDGWEW